MKVKKLYTGISLIEKKYKKNEKYFFLKTPNVAIIIAKFNNKFLIVSQKRIAVDKITYEFPGGFIDKGSSPKKTAKKELFEETGYKCINNPKKIISFYPEPGRIKCKYFCYSANKIIKVNNPEKGINLHLFSKSQILNLIKKEKFNHACHSYAFLSFLSSKNI
tara:strand:+ start:338 stop:826 length:489 start_codon:yes stop_codon:yes gene_type:complete